MKCKACRGGELVVSRETRKAPEFGLTNFVLVNVEVRRCPKCGEELVVIPRLSQLLVTLTTAVARKPARLTGEEIRFLRKRLDMTGDELGAAMGVDKATVSRWETNTQPIGPQADRLLRLMVMRELSPTDLAHVATEEPRQEVVRATDERGNWRLAG